MNEQKLLLTHYEKAQAAFLLENDRLLQVWFHTDGACHIGDIFVGKVKNVVPGINAAFVEYAKGKTGFLPLTDLKTRNILNRDATDTGDLKGNDEVLVQICKEPLKTKEATLTTDICFTGKNLILVPFSHGIHYSKKFTAPQRQTMYDIMTEVVTLLFGDMNVFLKKYGLIVRTNAVSCSMPELAKELHKLFHDASDILSFADKRTVFSCLYTEQSFFEKIIRDLPAAAVSSVTGNAADDADDGSAVIDEGFSEQQAPAKQTAQLRREIITDCRDIYELLMDTEDYAITASLRLYEDTMLPMLKLYGIKSKLDAALEKRVWLKSGGYLVIEPTEALTVIDVNSGKTAPSQKKTDAQELYLRTNKEAAVEIAHQLRLRNISGMVLIDFINMKSEEDNEALIALLQQEIKKDPVKTVYCDMTQLGLIELTRKKTEAPLAEKLRDIVVAE